MQKVHVSNFSCYHTMKPRPVESRGILQRPQVTSLNLSYPPHLSFRMSGNEFGRVASPASKLRTTKEK